MLGGGGVRGPGYTGWEGYPGNTRCEGHRGMRGPVVLDGKGTEPGDTG